MLHGETGKAHKIIRWKILPQKKMSFFIFLSILICFEDPLSVPVKVVLVRPEYVFIGREDGAIGQCEDVAGIILLYLNPF
jgi:hypothetical protein